VTGIPDVEDGIFSGANERIRYLSTNEYDYFITSNHYLLLLKNIYPGVDFSLKKQGEVQIFIV